MTKRQIGSALLFAVLWTAFMVWWSGDTGAANVIILSVCGALVAAAWAFAMKRFGHWPA
jgi:hypothetical protein